MLLDDLLVVLPPPSQPRENGTMAAWGDVHRRLGTVLPEHYIQFIKRYGTGVISDWLTVLNPFAANPHENLFIAGFELLAALREMKSQFPEAVPFPLYFEPAGLLPWGISIDGDIFCWRTSGLSGHWTIVIIGRSTDPEEFQLPFSRFLCGILTSDVRTLACPSDLAPAFEPTPVYEA